MKIKLYESKWDNKVEGELAYNFYNSVEDADIEKVKLSSVALLDKCKEFFDLEDEDNEYILNEIDVMEDEFSETDEEELNDLLNELYDFCDDYLILIDIKEEPEDAEVFVEPEEKGEEEIEPIEVQEVEPESEDDELVEVE